MTSSRLWDDAKATIDRVCEATKVLIADGKKFVMLGGEHSLTSGAVRAFKEKYEDLSVLHIDAHADMADPERRQQVGPWMRRQKSLRDLSHSAGRDKKP